MPDLFISYSRRDGDFVRRLHGVLAERGRDVWVDWEDIPAAEPWRDELHAGLEESEALAFVITPDSLASDECAVELERAVEGGKRILPLVLREPDGEQVPEPLAARNWIFFREGVDDFDQSVARLEAAIDTDRDWVRDHTRLLARASEWERRGRDASLLLRGADLRSAEADLSGWREGKTPVPTPLQREYVAASRRAAGRRTATLGAAAGVALAISIVLGILALLARDDAIDRERQARSRALAAAALVRVDSDPERATRLALEAIALHATPEAEEALRRGVSNVQARDRWRPRGATDFDVAPDGRRLAAATGGGRVLLRDVRTGRVRTLARHPGGAAVRFSADGDRAITSGLDRVVRVHDLRRGRPLTIRAGGALSAILSDDGRRVVGVQSDGTVRTWDARTGRPGPAVQAPPGWQGFNTSDDARRMVVTYESGAVRAFDPVAGRRLGRQRTDPGGQGSSEISGDGRLAVSSRPGGRAVVWQVATGKVVRTLDHRAAVASVEIDRDGSLVATGGTDNRVRLWDGSGAERHELRGHGDTVDQMVLSRNGRRLLTVGRDRSARIWFTGTGEQDLVVRGSGAEIEAVRMTPDGRHVVTRASDDEVRLLESSPGRALAVLRHRGRAQAAVLHPSRPFAASSGDDRIQIARSDSGETVGSDPASALTEAETRDLAFDPTGAKLAVADGAAVLVNDLRGHWRARDHGDWVNTVAWSPDGRRVISASDDGTARVLDAADASREAGPRLRHEAHVVEARFAAGARRAVTLECARGAGDAYCGESTVRLWDVAGAEVLDDLDVHGGANDVDVSPDGRAVAVAGRDGVARLWRPRGGATATRLTHRYGVNAVRFTRDGRRLATASDDGTARVFDARSGRRLAELGGHIDPVLDVDVSPDGRFVLTASGDRTARLWDLRTQRVVGVLGGHDGRVLRARFSRRGDQVLTVPEFGAAAVYACDACGPLERVVERAERLVPRP